MDKLLTFRLQILFLFFMFAPLTAHSEEVAAAIGAPYSLPETYYGGSSSPTVEGAVAIWWERYKQQWGVKPYGGLDCSFDLTRVSDGLHVGDVWLKSCTGGTYILASYVCPQGSINRDNGKCDIKYELAEDFNKPASSCTQKVGNPLDTSNGYKYQTELDIPSKGIGQVSLTRYYTNAGMSDEPLWHHQYEKRVVVIDPKEVRYTKQKTNNKYGSRADACTSGWMELGPKITESWAAGATAVYANGVCQITKNNTVVRNLPIVAANTIYSYITPGAVHLYRPDNSRLSFQYNNQSFTAMNGGEGSLELINQDTWRYTEQDGVVENYDHDGKLVSIKTNGVVQTLTYDPASGLLSQVQDSTGRKLTFAYTNNLLSSVTTDDNKTTSYTYNTSGLMTDVKRPDNTHRLYHYEDSRFPNYLTGITDERNVRYASWTYDSQGRGISSEHAGGAEKVTLAFNTDGSTTVTNALNKQTIYRFDDVAGARRVVKVEGQPTTNCAGANQNYTYTPEGFIASKTDWKGNKTSFAYNTKGQEISRTEADGTAIAKTIITEWHPTLNLKTKITEPDRETIFSYDTNGLLLNQKTRSLVTQ